MTGLAPSPTTTSVPASPVSPERRSAAHSRRPPWNGDQIAPDRSSRIRARSREERSAFGRIDRGPRSTAPPTDLRGSRRDPRAFQRRGDRRRHAPGRNRARRRGRRAAPRPPPCRRPARGAARPPPRGHDRHDRRVGAHPSSSSWVPDAHGRPSTPRRGCVPSVRRPTRFSGGEPTGNGSEGRSARSPVAGGPRGGSRSAASACSKARNAYGTAPSGANGIDDPSTSPSPARTRRGDRTTAPARRPGTAVP